LEIEPEILQTTEKEPNLSIRSLNWAPRNLSPRLNGAANFDFLQNVLNDPVNIIEELTARVIQTAENIRENPEMSVRTQASLVRRTQACMNNEGRHFEHLL
jgi:hypothetical protein